MDSLRRSERKITQRVMRQSLREYEQSLSSQADKEPKKNTHLHTLEHLNLKEEYKQPPKNYSFVIRPFKYNEKSYNWDPPIKEFFNTLNQREMSSMRYKDQMIQSQPRIKKFLYSQLVQNIIGAAAGYSCLVFYKAVNKYGGFLEVLAQDKLSQVIKEFENIFTISPNVYPTQLYFQIYKRHILCFELKEGGHLKRTVPVDIGQIRYFTLDELDKIIKNKLEDKQFNRDIFVLKDFADYVKFDYSILSTKYFFQNYGDVQIDTRIQRPDSMGFSIEEDTMVNQQTTMKALEYILYQQLEGEPNVKKLPIGRKLKAGEVCFAVNIDILGKEDISNQIHSKLSKVKFVQYLSERDALSYCQTWIPGCNYPQLYFKVKGVFTGGHQENVSMASVNVNLGPDDSQWFTLDVEHVPRLRAQVLNQFNTDIHLEEGLWFGSPQWMMANNYPIKKLIQKKGDLVYSGPGTLHWVRSLGKCYQVAWNIFQKTEKQWQCALERTKINHQIRFHQIFMPLKSLAVKILNHEHQKKTPFTYALQESVIQWMREEANDIKAYEQLNKNSFLRVKYKQLLDIESLCSLCSQQMLTIYAINENDQRLCLKCCLDANLCQKPKFYKKHDIDDFNELFTKILLLRQSKKQLQIFEVKALCRQYCGVVNCTQKKQLEKVQLSSQNASKIQKMMIPVKKQDNLILNSNEQEQIKNSSMPIFENIFPNPSAPKIDPIELLKLLYEAMPKVSCYNREQVIKQQILVLKQKGYVLESSISPAIRESCNQCKNQEQQKKGLPNNENIKCKREQKDLNKEYNLDEILSKTQNKNKKVPSNIMIASHIKIQKQNNQFQDKSSKISKNQAVKIQGPNAQVKKQHENLLKDKISEKQVDERLPNNSHSKMSKRVKRQIDDTFQGVNIEWKGI